MKKAILATKVGMTQIFGEDGSLTCQGLHIKNTVFRELIMIQNRFRFCHNKILESVIFVLRIDLYKIQIQSFIVSGRFFLESPLVAYQYQLADSS